MKELKINVPEGYEIDKEASTFECIKFKPINKVNIWEDIKRISGVYIDLESNIKADPCAKLLASDRNKLMYINEKHAKSALAMAQISQLMPYYGGPITKEEWNNPGIYKYCIENNSNSIDLTLHNNKVEFLAFHTLEQRRRFMSYPENVQLVKEYLMI